MNISDQGKEFTKSWEKFCSKPYFDIDGTATIGYGSTYYPGGKRVTFQDLPITEEQASKMLDSVFIWIAGELNLLLKVSVTQNQFDALCDFIYNLGIENFRSSTLLRKLNTGDYQGASEEFTRWDMAGGKEVMGLLKRRQAEKGLFLS